MAKRRSPGDGGLYWSEERQRWIAEVTVGYRPNGRRITRKASDTTKTGAKDKLKDLLDDLDNGVTNVSRRYTVGDAVSDWLKYGLSDRDDQTIRKYEYLASKNIIPHIGSRPLATLSVEDIDRWLAARRSELATSTLQRLLSMLRRAITHAQARDRVRRNVALLSTAPRGRVGRPSKALTLEQATSVLDAAEEMSLHAYVVVSLLTGARTEELRALTWNDVDLVGDRDADPPVPPTLRVWRSVRADGDTKTKRSRRTLKMPLRCVHALRAHQNRQAEAKEREGDKWQEHGLVFASEVGTELDAANVRRSFRAVIKKAGLDPKRWTPRELRHSFVSLLSNNAGVSIEDISRLVGHRTTVVTETVYRQELRPALTEGAEAMDVLFPITVAETTRS